MPASNLNNILKRLLKQPTAPFHEYHVRAEIEALLKDCPHVKLKRDKFGNLLATYKNGKSKSKPTWVLGAHMDHPAFIKPPGSTKKDEWDFLGGVGKLEVEAGVQRGLLDAGACEATATQASGIRSAGISLPLGNYHNLNDFRQVAPEFVMMDDLKSMIDLLKALVATKHDGIGERTIRESVELRMQDYAAHLAAGTKLFK